MSRPVLEPFGPISLEWDRYYVLGLEVSRVSASIGAWLDVTDLCCIDHQHNCYTVTAAQGIETEVKSKTELTDLRTFHGTLPAVGAIDGWSGTSLDSGFWYQSFLHDR